MGRSREMGGLEHMARGGRLQELGLSRLALGTAQILGFNCLNKLVLTWGSSARSGVGL